jgi:hypothetical protein
MWSMMDLNAAQSRISVISVRKHINTMADHRAGLSPQPYAVSRQLISASEVLGTRSVPCGSEIAKDGF